MAPVHPEIGLHGNGGGNEIGEFVEDFELGLTCWFVAFSVPIVFSPACSWDSGARNAFDHIGGLQQCNLQERCTFDGQLRFEVSGPRAVTSQTTYWFILVSAIHDYIFISHDGIALS